MLKLAPLFSSGAVLCRGKEIRVFGQAAPGAQVHVQLLDSAGCLLAETTVCAEEGHFLAYLAPQQAQTGCTLHVSDGQATCTACDVAIGEVYLAGGQSNMELELQNADEGPGLIPLHNDPDLRYFNVPKRSYRDDEAIRAEEASHWEKVVPGNARDMSAVAYFFARRLREQLQVPVGIIDCYWGGTSVTAWMDEAALRQTAEGQRYLQEYAQRVGDKTLAQWQQEEADFQAYVNGWNAQADVLKKEVPGITFEEINRRIGAMVWNPPVGPGAPNRPGGLAETMLKRVAPVTLTGCLFYQGEDDAPRTTCYDILLESMIRFWRGMFRDEELPFLFVQLPMWGDSGAPENGQWAAIRHAQDLVFRRVKNTGMAVTIDCGEFDNIHPTDKRTVGERLYEQAKTVVYHAEGEHSPHAAAKHTCGKVLTVRLSAPVKEVGGAANLLEIAGADGVFHPAETVVAGDCLHLTSSAVACPVSARYAHVAWGKVHLFGENGLPLAPFVIG